MMVLNDASEGRLTRRYNREKAACPRMGDGSTITVTSAPCTSVHKNNNNSRGGGGESASKAAQASVLSIPFSPPQRIKSNDSMKLYSAYSGSSSPSHLISLDEVGSSRGSNGHCDNDRCTPRTSSNAILSLLLLIVVGGGVAVLILRSSNSSHPTNDSLVRQDAAAAEQRIKSQRYLAELERKLESDEALLVQSLQAQLETALTEKLALQNQVEALQRDAQNLREEQQSSASLNRPTALRGNNRDLELLQIQRSELQSGLQALAKQRLLEQWGQGPHRVQVSLRFEVHRSNDNNNSQPSSSTEDATILLELAPIDDMPYTVWWFLEQVTRRLFDDGQASLDRNLPHIVQVDPVDDEARRRFDQAGLTHLLFQEYSSAFPHAPYTVGYAGRPGGPGWYINVQDNQKLHGPGGQDGKKGQELSPRGEADPCFAKVVEGLDVVDRIHRQPVDGDFVLQTNVAITGMKLLTV